jgi:hypothetical protein
LLLEGENAGAEALRHAENFYVTDKQFEGFLEQHKDIPFLVPESNVKVHVDTNCLVSQFIKIYLFTTHPLFSLFKSHTLKIHLALAGF